MQRRSAQGVVFVHACPKALCQHVEWALERVVGTPVSLAWGEQPVTHGSYRAEVAWTGAPGTGAKLVAALKQWPMLRFEVTEEASHGNDGERMSYVPGHGVFRAPTTRSSAHSTCWQSAFGHACTKTTPWVDRRCTRHLHRLDWSRLPLRTIRFGDALCSAVTKQGFREQSAR